MAADEHVCHLDSVSKLQPVGEHRFENFGLNFLPGVQTDLIGAGVNCGKAHLSTRRANG